MPAERFYAPPHCFEKSKILLPPDESYHACKVLRLKKKNLIRIFDGTGAEYKVELEKPDPEKAVGRIIEKYFPDVESPIKIILCTAAVKLNSFERILKNSAEAGASAILPLITERTDPYLQSGFEKRYARFSKIILNAVKQSGRTLVPKLLPFADLHRCLTQYQNISGKFILTEPRNQSEIHLPDSQDFSELALLIGPEGGWTQREITSARQSGFAPFSLGPRILRTENAAMIAVALFQLLPSMRRGSVSTA